MEQDDRPCHKSEVFSDESEPDLSGRSSPSSASDSSGDNSNEPDVNDCQRADCVIRNLARRPNSEPAFTSGARAAVTAQVDHDSSMHVIAYLRRAFVQSREASDGRRIAQAPPSLQPASQDQNERTSSQQRQDLNRGTSKPQPTLQDTDMETAQRRIEALCVVPHTFAELCSKLRAFLLLRFSFGALTLGVATDGIELLMLAN